MNLEKATKEQRLYAERQVALGRGEIFKIDYVDLEPVKKTAEGDDIVTVGGEKYRRVNRSREYLVGKMSAGTTGGVLSVLGVLFLRGTNLKEMMGSSHNLAFLEVLDDHHLSVLIALALGDSEEVEFVKENFDLAGWVTDVLSLFFKYNNFFALVGKFQTFLQNLGVTEEQVRTMALGNPSE